MIGRNVTGVRDDAANLDNLDRLLDVVKREKGNAGTLHHHAAIHLYALPIDPAVIVSQQCRDCGPNVVRASHSTESRVIGD